MHVSSVPTWLSSFPFRADPHLCSHLSAPGASKEPGCCWHLQAQLLQQWLMAAVLQCPCCSCTPGNKTVKSSHAVFACSQSHCPCTPALLLMGSSASLCLPVWVGLIPNLGRGSSVLHEKPGHSPVQVPVNLLQKGISLLLGHLAALGI